MRTWVGVLACVFVSSTASADVYSDLVKGDEATRSRAALEVIKHPGDHARGVLRRAINTAAGRPDPKHLPHLKNLVKDEALDPTTRAVAALALGRIGNARPGIWPPGAGDPAVHDPLPVFARNALLDCVGSENPRTLRRACAEALGLAKVPGAEPILVPIAQDSDEDPILRIFAGRSLVRITGRLSVSTEAFDELPELFVAGTSP